VAIAKCPECGTATKRAKFCPECGTPTAQGVAARQASGTTAEQPATDDTPEPAVEREEDEQEIRSGIPDSTLPPVAKRTTKYVITRRGR
jgi:hypothetical protein